MDNCKSEMNCHDSKSSVVCWLILLFFTIQLRVLIVRAEEAPVNKLPAEGGDNGGDEVIAGKHNDLEAAKGKAPEVKVPSNKNDYAQAVVVTGIKHAVVGQDESEEVSTKTPKVSRLHLHLHSLSVYCRLHSVKH